MPAPVLAGGSRDAARAVARGQVLLDVAAVAVGDEAAADEGVLHDEGLAQDGQVNGLHVVALDPGLAHGHVGRAARLDLGGRGPHMLGQVAQPRSGRAVGLEDGLVAEQHRDGDGQHNGEQPVPRRGRAVGLEGAADGVLGREAWRVGRSARSRSACEPAGSVNSHSPSQRIEEVPDHPGPRSLTGGMPGLGVDGAQQALSVCDALEGGCAGEEREAAQSSVGQARGTTGKARLETAAAAVAVGGQTQRQRRGGRGSMIVYSWLGRLRWSSIRPPSALHVSHHQRVRVTLPMRPRQLGGLPCTRMAASCPDRGALAASRPSVLPSGCLMLARPAQHQHRTKRKHACVVGKFARRTNWKCKRSTCARVYSDPL